MTISNYYHYLHPSLHPEDMIQKLTREYEEECDKLGFMAFPETNDVIVQREHSSQTNNNFLEALENEDNYNIEFDELEFVAKISLALTLIKE